MKLNETAAALCKLCMFSLLRKNTFFQIIEALDTIEWEYNQRSASIYPLISCLLYLICSKQ